MLLNSFANFDFIKDDVLRENITQIFKETNRFLELSYESFTPSFQSSLRRVVIIYSSAIIEALLHHIIKQSKKPLGFSDFTWNFLANPHIVHSYQDESGKNIQIICAKRYKKSVKVAKISTFKYLNQIALKSNLISESLFKDIERVRRLRNRIHIASLSDIEKIYSRKTANNALKTTAAVLSVAQVI